MLPLFSITTLASLTIRNSAVHGLQVGLASTRGRVGLQAVHGHPTVAHQRAGSIKLLRNIDSCEALFFTLDVTLLRLLLASTSLCTSLCTSF